MKQFIILLTIITVLTNCQNQTSNIQNQTLNEEPHHGNIVELTEAQFKNVSIATGKLESRNMSGSIKVNGMLDVPPQNLITMSVPYGGTVKQTDLLQGMKITKGQVLVTLEHPDYIQLQQEYLDAKSKLNFAALELSREEELQKANVNAVKTYQQIVSEYESLKARVSGLEQKLSMINITPQQLKENGITKQVKLYAPISGYVMQVNVNIGMYVNPNDIICKLVDTRHLHAELTVFEKDITNVKIGQKVRFNFNNESKERTATVYLLGKEIGADRTVRVHCHLDNEDPTLLPGMYLKAQIETQSKGVMAIPSKAVVQSDGKSYLFISKGIEQEDGKPMYHFEKYEVTTGISDNGFTEIMLSDELDKNTNIVITGTYDLLSKMNNGESEEGHAH
jgi:membrane fusion protein, heavy metal efflux system